MNLLEIALLKINRKIILIIIIIFAFIIANLSPSGNVASNFFIAQKFPENINGWIGQNLEIEKTNEVFSVISPVDLVLRTYQKYGEKNEINLTLVLTYDKKKVHDPQICYKLQGFKFLNAKKVRLSSNLTANFMNTKKANQNYLFMYWYTDLDKNYTTRSEFWQNIILKKIINKPIKTYGIVILYTPIKNAENLKKFALKVNDILFLQIRK
jgi:hypothetical protein